MRSIDKTLKYVFYFLFFAIPLVLFPKTSEIFEFNKMILTYSCTSLIAGLWLIKMVLSKRIIFHRTLIDTPLFLFLIAMGISTLFSIDTHTSIFGYYSRFNGGLLSLVAYSTLYWAYVSNLNTENTKTAIKMLFISTLISSVWAILEHFGHSFSCLIFPDFRVFDNSCWIQDVQNRVYSSFGQPNWLAAWIVALIPLTWASSAIFKFQSKNFLTAIPHLTSHILSLIFFITLLFTKSRSGIVAFGVSYLVYWGYYLFTTKSYITKRFLKFLLPTSYFLLLTFLIGTPWFSFWKPPATHEPPIISTPALETGGTESGQIRKIVWSGTFEIWTHNPIFGTGLETFAHSYYNFRPIAHNLTSEWDYLYNKAHNEYLNYAATTGTLGLISYIFLILASILIIVRSLQHTNNNNLLKIGILSGYFTILITNFFGFSTVPINILFFLFPALALSLNQKESEIPGKQINTNQKLLIILIVVAFLDLLFAIFEYWHSDFTYSKAKRLNDSGNYAESSKLLDNLVTKRPYEPIYWDELAAASTNIAIYNSENSRNEEAQYFSEKSYLESKKAMDLSPTNVTLKRKAATRFVGLSAIDQKYLALAKTILEDAVKLAPTDAKLHYNLGLTYLRTGDVDRAVETIKKTIELKPNYELAHYALALIYIDQGNKEDAKLELIYILEKINPNNVNAQRELNELQ